MLELVPVVVVDAADSEGLESVLHSGWIESKQKLDTVTERNRIGRTEN